MINGLFLDPRAWTIDFKSSRFWNPNKHGINIELHSDAFNIPSTGIDSKYKFVIVGEVWEIPMRKTLEFLRKRGVYVFLTAREPFKTDILKDAMFSYHRFERNGEYFFKPDAILAAGQAYADLWGDKARTFITGYPRFDYYVDSTPWPSKKSIAKKHGLRGDKKWIFFPSYPPYHYKRVGESDTLVDIYDARENTLIALDKFAQNNKEFQIVVKIHPASMKPFIKKTGSGKEVAGVLLDRYNKPTDSMVVIGDIRNDGSVSRDVLVNSDIVCGFTTTMLMEASVAKKPAVHILFGNTSSLDGIPEYSKNIPTARSAGELEKLLKNTKYVNNDMVYKYLHSIDGLACERMCEAIRKIVK